MAQWLSQPPGSKCHARCLIGDGRFKGPDELSLDIRPQRSCAGFDRMLQEALDSLLSSCGQCSDVAAPGLRLGLAQVASETEEIPHLLWVLSRKAVGQPRCLRGLAQLTNLRGQALIPGGGGPFRLGVTSLGEVGQGKAINLVGDFI